MTTETQKPTIEDEQAFLDQLTEDLNPDEPLKYIVELGRRLSLLIPEEQRKAERAVMVAYLDEVAAREPSRPPDEQTK